MEKLNYEKNKKIIIPVGLILLGVIAAFICFFAVAGGKGKKDNSNKNVLNYKDDGSLVLEVNFKNNKMQDFNLEIEKQGKEILDKDFKRENNEFKKTIDLRKILYENGFGFYDLKVKFKKGLFKKKYKKHISFTKIEEIKNAVVEADYYNGKYELTIDNLKDVKKYEIRVEKNGKVKEYKHEVSKEEIDDENIVIDITDIITELGTGTYTIQIDNIIDKNVRGIPKIIQFTAKKIVEKPEAKVISTSLDRKILEIEEKENIKEYEVSLNKGDELVSKVTVKNKLNITDYLYKNNKQEGIYNIEIKPVVENDDNVIVSENVQNSSIKKIGNVDIKYPLPDIKEIILGNSLFNNKPRILIDAKEDFKYLVEIKSNKFKKDIDYKVLEGDKAFLSKEEIDSLEEGEEVTVTITKESTSTKEKSYPYTKTFVKKINKDLIPFGYLVEK